MLDNNLAKKLLGDNQVGDDDSVNTPKNQSEQESMFGDNENKRNGRPTKGYRWMAFTFIMIAILCLIVIFHEKFEKLKDNAASGITDSITKGTDWIRGKDDKKGDTPAGGDTNPPVDPPTDDNKPKEGGGVVPPVNTNTEDQGGHTPEVKPEDKVDPAET